MSELLKTKKQILDLLKGKAMTVVELSKELRLSRATIRQHIGEMQKAGVVEEIPNPYFRKHVSYKAKRPEGKMILNDAKLRWNAGNILFEEKKYDLALNEFDAAIKIDPNYGDAYFNKALTEMMMRNMLVAAEKDLEKCMKIQPKSHDAATLMGQIMEKKGEFEKAKFWYERALEFYPYYSYAKTSLEKLLQNHKDLS